MTNVIRGGIYIVKLDPTLGSEIAGERPCIVVQNNLGNESSKTTVVVPVTKKPPKRDYRFNAVMEPDETGLLLTSTAKCEHMKSVSIEHRIERKVGQLTSEVMFRLEEALLYELGIDADYHAGHAGGEIGFDVQ